MNNRYALPVSTLIDSKIINGVPIVYTQELCDNTVTGVFTRPDMPGKRWTFPVVNLYGDPWDMAFPAISPALIREMFPSSK